ncbi:MAG TPA: hypothetical protein ENJ82_12575 [Bacteroidetes bacterium]|nr:hypothetical protein [Bacteroidota bacterium]
MNSNGIRLVHRAMVPVRSQSSDAAEMVSQLLFGDLVEVLETDRQWQRIRGLSDQYEGWIDEKMSHPISENWLATVNHWEYVDHASRVIIAQENQEETPLHLTYGCRIPIQKGQEHQAIRQIQLENWAAEIPQFTSKPARAATPTNLIAIAAQYLGAPYLWGGKYLWGIDCSGLTQMVFAQCGIQLPRDASQQAKKGKEIAFGEHQAGDLAFFQNEKGKVTHVGIILENNLVRHAAGHVHDDLLIANGIFGKYTQTLTHVLCTIKRIH